MDGFDFVNEMTIDGVTYAAFRSPSDPRKCLIVRGEDRYECDSIRAVWSPEILPTLF